MQTETERGSVDLKDFFRASEAREDRWQQLHSTARSLCLPRSSPELGECAEQLLGKLELLENCWAYPGTDLPGEVRELGSNSDSVAGARLTVRSPGAKDYLFKPLDEFIFWCLLPVESEILTGSHRYT